jgi:hypothetical protein
MLKYRYILLLGLWLGSLLTAEAQLLSRPVSLSGRSVTLGQALDELAADYGISLVYSSYFVPTGRRVDLRLAETPLATALELLLAGTNVGYQELHGCIVLKPIEPEPEQLTQLEPRRTAPRQTSPLYQEPVPDEQLREARC